VYAAGHVQVHPLTNDPVTDAALLLQFAAFVHSTGVHVG
jgi:hypothetical protein